MLTYATWPGVVLSESNQTPAAETLNHCKRDTKTLETLETLGTELEVHPGREGP